MPGQHDHCPVEPILSTVLLTCLLSQGLAGADERLERVVGAHAVRNVPADFLVKVVENGVRASFRQVQIVSGGSAAAGQAGDGNAAAAFEDRNDVIVQPRTVVEKQSSCGLQLDETPPCAYWRGARR